MEFSALALWWELEELGGFEGSYIFGNVVDPLLLLCSFTSLLCWMQTVLWTNPEQKSSWESEPEFSKNVILEAGTHTSLRHTEQSNANRGSKEYLLATWCLHPNFTSSSKWVIIIGHSLLSPVSDWDPFQLRTSSLLAQLCTGDLHSPRAAHVDGAIGIPHLTVATVLYC